MAKRAAEKRAQIREEERVEPNPKSLTLILIGGRESRGQAQGNKGLAGTITATPGTEVIRTAIH